MNINKELERAVYERNLEEIKALLSAGANANHQVEWNRDTLLHTTSNAEIAKELLLHGAVVDARNKYNETPLHYSITHAKGSELVRELLKHGADVNATNRKGNTALNLAVKKSHINMEVVKELLEHGGDINIRNRENSVYDYYSTSLDNAVEHRPNLACAKLLIKITLMRNFNKDYRKIINLSPYKKCKNYNELSSYMNDCVCEIRKMKTDIIDNNVSLYEIITTKETNGDILYTMNDEGIKSIKNKVFQVLTSYPIYHDVISCKIAPTLERACLLKKLSEVEVYTSLNVSDHAQDVTEKCIVLDPYSKDEVAQYLSDNDLLNIILAFFRCTDQPLCLAENFTASSKHSNTEFCEASTSNDAKRARLE